MRLIKRMYEINNKFKTLVYTRSGLNDIFSNLSVFLKFFHYQKLPYENLHISSPVYDQLPLFLDFKHIKYINTPDFNDYCLVSEACNGQYSNANKNNSFYISNFVSLKNNFIPKIDADTTSIHLRFYLSEKKQMSHKQELEIYLQNILSIYDKDEKYEIFSDANCESFLMENLPYDNISYDMPSNSINVSTTPFNNKDSLRRTNCLHSLQSLYKMAFSKKVYKTLGNFTSSCKIFNPDVTIKSF